MEDLIAEFDALAICIGSEVPRDLNVPGEISGFILQWIFCHNRMIEYLARNDIDPIMAKDKNVLVIGGGDTGSDCVGTSIRQGAKSVTQLELFLNLLRLRINPLLGLTGLKLRTSAHEEGCERKWSILTKSFEANEKKRLKVELCKVDWKKDNMVVLKCMRLKVQT